MGPAFLRHVQRCKVLLHVVDGSSDDPIGDFITVNEELEKHDPFLAKKPQVVVLNKIDVSEVKELEDDLISELKDAKEVIIIRFFLFSIDRKIKS